MAGEFEDSAGSQWQADYLPTGSISFGRFETESLSWERRSSFSHNRYLEEVEKYSTPGSVTEKKAYFEAHFRKKALLHQASSEFQNGAECQTIENNFEDRRNCLEEFVNLDDGKQLDFSWCRETTHVMDSHEQEVINKEQEIIDYEQEEYPPSDFQIEVANCMGEGVSDTNDEVVLHGEASPTRSAYESMQSDQVTSDIVEHSPENKSGNVEILHEKGDESSKNIVPARNAASKSKKIQKTPPKVKAPVKQETVKEKLQTRTQNSRSNLNGKSSLSSHNASIKSVRNMDRESTLRGKTEKQSSASVPPPISSGPRDRKAEDCGDLSAKLRQHDKSERSLKAKKGFSASQTICGKSEITLQQPANRPRGCTNSIKESKKTIVFNFKCNERADKRKEFYMKLEEKHHAKEAEINEVQARVQEETEAEIKQFRRSLNFKATPMPSFYRETVPRATDGRKTDAPPSKSSKVRTKCSSPGSNISSQEKPSECCKVSNQQGPSMMEPSSFTQEECPPAIEDDTSCLIQASIYDKLDERRESPTSHTAKKIDAEEGDKPGVQQEEGKVKRKETINKVGGGMGKSETMRKAIKGGISGSLAVHVAS